MPNPKIDTLFTKLTTEVTEARGAMASAVVYIKGVPTLLQALRDELDLTPEQEATFDAALVTLDEGEQEVIAALSANAPAPAPPTP